MAINPRIHRQVVTNVIVSCVFRYAFPAVTRRFPRRAYSVRNTERVRFSLSSSISWNRSMTAMKITTSTRNAFAMKLMTDMEFTMRNGMAASCVRETSCRSIRRTAATRYPSSIPKTPSARTQAPVSQRSNRSTHSGRLSLRR